MEIFVGFENRSTEQPHDLYIVRRAVVSVYALMPTTQLFAHIASNSFLEYGLEMAP